MIQQLELVLLPEEAADEAKVLKKAAQQLSVSAERIRGINLLRRSIDARSRKVLIRMLSEIFIDEDPPVQNKEEYEFNFSRNVSQAESVHIIGFGPAGMFAALRLIELGKKPIIIERGKDVRSRRRDLAAINKLGIVNPESNYCFGEGGAGTYSDGKLYTRSGKRGNIRRILSVFVKHGADPDILIDAHPHIGTNKLPGVVQSIRETILNAGGEIHFETRLDDIISQNGKIINILVSKIASGEQIEIPCHKIILATGHSARDIYELLNRKNIRIERKAFALGVRIEHPQEIIDKVQYHCESRSPYLPPASYSLAANFKGRGVYSFCMCPGGIIAPAATSAGEIVVNGWSPSKRNNPFANSGMVVSVTEEDYIPYENFGPLAGLQFQKQVEQKAFTAGGGMLVAPAQRLIDFMQRKLSSSLPECSYIPGVKSVLMDEVLPHAISNTLREGLGHFGKKMKEYYTNEALLVATESRTSSPVRIPRDPETLAHPDVMGLYPCAEGAGYAGGIVSAAMDGERCAEAAAGL
ncbi:MAG: FAD-binding protein [Bacteroidetes bacterium]|nr:MAG: FAD-binding protein [Bacteroidota bacterium]REK08154.1 MAG: FAD-binding protein [Bacteroidota bacterium]REK32359.1 MAG: FAD-binding protein [Bacteroidota bacterium]REK49593.1 MAG: FAD-binding protein [Bacteroidota bacterium]